MRTSRYQEISAAREILELPEIATMAEIKKSYRSLLAKWHPDTSSEEREVCNEMTRKIVSAYQVITDYCRQYQYSFSEDAVRRHLSPEDWWFDRFGNDPLWGNNKESNG